MNKIILVFTIFPVFAFSQMNQGNEPSINDSIVMYICDSNATQYENLIGSNQTWDYSTIGGILDPNSPGNVRTKDVSVTAPDLLTKDSLFAGAIKKYSIGTSINTYYSSNSSQRISQGYIFNELTLGDVIVNLTKGSNPNVEILNDYPFALSGITTDNFAGEITFQGTQILPTTGTSIAKIDGSGTLILPGNNSYSNVLRYHLRDSASANTILGQVSLVRNWYEYYDYTISKLPIFISINLVINTPLTDISTSLMLSKHQPTSFVGIDENELSSVELYPNPANHILNVNPLGNFEFEVSSIGGERLISGKNESKIDISELPSGIYLFKIISNKATKTLRFVKN
jgi:hypothetical protein